MLLSLKVYRSHIPRFLMATSFALLFNLFAWAQSELSGKVIDHSSKKAIPNSNVFLSSATIGTKTGNDGNFTLSDIKPGKYELVISFVGFETYRLAVTIDGRSQNLGDIELVPKSVSLKEVHIRGAVNSAWLRNYQWFKDSFLGTTSLAKECKILNPAILDLTYHSKNDSLIASTDDFLIIGNDALGYRVKYLVDNFVRCDSGKRISYKGSVLFENMQGTASQEKRWLKKRQKVYEESLTHFLRAAVANRLGDEGFRVFQYAIYANPYRSRDSVIEAKINLFTKKIASKSNRYRDSLSFWKKQFELPKTLRSLMNFPLNPNEFVSLTDKKGVYALGCGHDGLYIIYNKARNFPKNGSIEYLSSPYNNDSSLLTFNSLFALFDNNGWLIEPDSISIAGEWSRNKVAGLLPTDYEPQ